MVRSAIIPAGSWPRRMPAAIAAGYCGELTVEAFLKRVGTEYPQPRVKEGKRQLWLRDDLDRQDHQRPERDQTAAGRKSGRTLPKGVAHHAPVTPGAI